MRYLSRKEFAERVGVTPGALSHYKLPPPDVVIGTVRGWLPETVDEWQARRPGRGARTDLLPTHTVVPAADFDRLAADADADAVGPNEAMRAVARRPRAYRDH